MPALGERTVRTEISLQGTSGVGRAADIQVVQRRERRGLCPGRWQAALQVVAAQDERLEVGERSVAAPARRQPPALHVTCACCSTCCPSLPLEYQIFRESSVHDLRHW